ncbi:MAG: hypothetical protein NTW28_26065 [Candidatus Solibacter sp.]|nr:hypothetical protein [Candidatus Solibacter sp.]
MHWYDGGVTPPRPEGMDPKRRMPIDGMYFSGEKGVIWSGFTGGPSVLGDELKRSFAPPAKTVARTTDHYLEWIAAAKGGPPANCNFEFGSLITEVALLGVIAQRSPNRHLDWDSGNLRIPNDAAANEFVQPSYRNGWSL